MRSRDDTSFPLFLLRAPVKDIRRGSVMRPESHEDASTEANYRVETKAIGKHVIHLQHVLEIFIGDARIIPVFKICNSRRNSCDCVPRHLRPASSRSRITADKRPRNRERERERERETAVHRETVWRVTPRNGEIQLAGRNSAKAKGTARRHKKNSKRVEHFVGKVVKKIPVT